MPSSHLYFDISLLLHLGLIPFIGLDAGLLYPEVPYMGEGLMPVEYWELEPAHKNFFENGAAVQFNHRVLVCTI